MLTFLRLVFLSNPRQSKSPTDQLTSCDFFMAWTLAALNDLSPYAHICFSIIYVQHMTHRVCLAVEVWRKKVQKVNELWLRALASNESWQWWLNSHSQHDQTGLAVNEEGGVCSDRRRPLHSDTVIWVSQTTPGHVLEIYATHLWFS